MKCDVSGCCKGDQSFRASGVLQPRVRNQFLLTHVEENTCNIEAGLHYFSILASYFIWLFKGCVGVQLCVYICTHILSHIGGSWRYIAGTYCLVYELSQALDDFISRARQIIKLKKKEKKENKKKKMSKQSDIFCTDPSLYRIIKKISVLEYLLTLGLWDPCTLCRKHEKGWIINVWSGSYIYYIHWLAPFISYLKG